MPPEQSEQNEFLKDLVPPVNDDPFAPPAVETPAEAPAEEDQEEARNRRERRLQSKLQAERESSIALAARLEALTEAQKFRGENPEGDHLKSIERIYGTGTPEAIEATELLKSALLNVEKQATDKALAAFRDEQAKERDAVVNEERNLDTMVEDIEDTYGVTLDDKGQQAFFQLLEKLSPKDRQGNVIEYADHHAVYEELQARRAPANTRAKDLASRSMVRAGASPSTTVKNDVDERWLMENGII